MGESQNYFQKLEPLFRKYAPPDIRKSQEYQHATNNLMDILLLADRVLAASVETVEAGRVKNIADKLSKVNCLRTFLVIQVMIYFVMLSFG